MKITFQDLKDMTPVNVAEDVLAKLPKDYNLEAVSMDDPRLTSPASERAAMSLKDGQTVVMPEKVEDVIVDPRPVTINGDDVSLEWFVRCEVDGKPGRVALADLARQDAAQQGAHDVSKYLITNKAFDPKSRILALLGKTIKGQGTVAYEKATWTNGVVTGKKQGSCTNLVFA